MKKISERAKISITVLILVLNILICGMLGFSEDVLEFVVIASFWVVCMVTSPFKEKSDRVKIIIVAVI